MINTLSKDAAVGAVSRRAARRLMVARWLAMTWLVAGAFIGATAALAQPGLGNGYVGVTLADLNPDQAVTVGMSGPLVGAVAVVEGGPAYASGLRQYDVVRSIDGRRVGSAADAIGLLRAKKVGEKVLIGIVHPQGNGRSLSIEIAVTVLQRPPGYGENTGSAPGMQQMPAMEPKPGRQSMGELRVVDPRAVILGTQQQRGHCSAMVPPGWSMRASELGKTADLDGPGGAHASWGIDGVNTQGGGFYGPIMGPPEARALYLAGGVARGKARYVGPSFMVAGYFVGHKFATENSQGTVLYHTWPGPSRSEYIQSIFVSSAPNGSVDLARQAEAVMVSITCRTQLRPVPNAGVPGGPQSHGGGSKRTAGNEEDAMQDYNAQLGSQWATSPTTGQKYLLDYATQWSNSGPDGAGYYVKAGNGLERLRPGWH